MVDIEDQIRKAMEEGKFDDLAGKGKPLKLEEDLLADSDWRLAHHVLKSGGFTLPWLETRQELEKDIQALRDTLALAWDWRKDNLHLPQVEVEWQRVLRDFREKARALNKKIRDYNLQAPLERFQMLPINIEAEIKAITSGG